MQAQGRGARRIEYNGVVVVSLADLMIRAVAADLSATGMRLFLEAPLWDGALVRLSFVLAGLIEVELDGTLVRHGSPAPRCQWGVKFCAMPEDIRERLEAYVRSRAKGPPPIPARRPATEPPPPRLYADDPPTMVYEEDTLTGLLENSQPAAPAEPDLVVQLPLTSSLSAPERS